MITCPLDDETEELPVAISISEEMCPFKIYNAVTLAPKYTGTGN